MFSDGLIIPVGNNAQRSGDVVVGEIRFNTDAQTYEGYDGNNWGSLGGMTDVDKDTFITAENSAGADNDELKFFTAGVERLRIFLMVISVQGGDITSSGNLQIAGNISSSGNIFGTNLGDSHSFSTRITTAEIELENTLVSEFLLNYQNKYQVRLQHQVEVFQLVLLQKK